MCRAASSGCGDTLQASSMCHERARGCRSRGSRSREGPERAVRAGGRAGIGASRTLEGRVRGVRARSPCPTVSGCATIRPGVNVLPRGTVNTSIHTIAHKEVRFCNVWSESSELSYVVMRAREPPPDGHTLP
eukprot:357548-Prymnesium_polylepis.1